jgi:CheY-like chemotaxis protein
VPSETCRIAPLASGNTLHKVVYIEDNPSNIAFMHDLMGDLPSVDLITAPTAEIGLELIRSHRPEVVIMDINLPGMSGFDAVQRLREWPETRTIPVIVCRQRRCSRTPSAPRRPAFTAASPSR